MQSKHIFLETWKCRTSPEKSSADSFSVKPASWARHPLNSPGNPPPGSRIPIIRRVMKIHIWNRPFAALNSRICGRARCFLSKSDPFTIFSKETHTSSPRNPPPKTDILTSSSENMGNPTTRRQFPSRFLTGKWNSVIFKLKGTT